MSPEFNLIKQYFTRSTMQTDLGVGDDAALVRVQAGYQLAVSSDMLVSGTHFFADAAPYDIGWKALAVNISDMAAMGAQPKWATLALALPELNESWLAEFSRGFFACADAFKVDLIGGDTTRGPLNISVAIMGEVPAGKALRRDGAKIGDDIWVSGQLGSAALALAHLQGKTSLNSDALEANIHALLRPVPRADLGLKLRDIATSAIDISDGLAADLGHILSASNVSGKIHLNTLPCSDFVKNAGFQYAIAGGDDYELCFTAPQNMREKIKQISAELNIPIALAGRITEHNYAGAGHESFKLVVLDDNHQPISIEKTGYDHFT